MMLVRNISAGLGAFKAWNAASPGKEERRAGRKNGRKKEGRDERTEGRKNGRQKGTEGRE